MAANLIKLLHETQSTSGPGATSTDARLGRERVFTALFDEAPIGMMLVAVRPQGACPIRVNDAACAMLGYTEPELCALSIDDLTDPVERDSDVGRFAPLNSGQVSTLRLERKYLRKDGSAVWVDLTANAVGADSADSLLFLNVLVDITERKSAEAALHASEESMRSLVEGLPGFVYRCDIDAVMSTTYVSPQVKDICGITAEQYLADPESWVNLIHPEDRQAVISAYVTAIETAKVFEMDYRLIDAQGRERWVRDHAVTVRDVEGRPLYCQGVVLDVTHSKEAAAARAESAAKSKFLAGMSHELRTPLNAVIGFAQLLGRSDLTEKQSRYVTNIRASGEQLLGLVNDLLDLTKVQAGEMDVHPEAVSVRESIAEAVARMSPLATTGQIDLAAGECADGIAVTADKRRLGQVLLNLLSNAIKFTHAGGRVRITCFVDGERVSIAIHDTGVGIGPADQQAIFDEFKQVGSRTKEVQGTGLGLALSKRLVEAMHGTIGVESTPGRGSTFTVSLPMSHSR